MWIIFFFSMHTNMSTTCHNTYVISHTSHMPARTLHSALKLLLITRMQGMTRDTSKALLAWYENPGVLTLLLCSCCDRARVVLVL